MQLIMQLIMHIMYIIQIKNLELGLNFIIILLILLLQSAVNLSIYTPLIIN